MTDASDLTRDDRVLLIGVLAYLDGHVISGATSDRDAAGTLHAQLSRLRRDLGRVLGREAEDNDLHEALDQMVTRLRRSIGEPG